MSKQSRSALPDHRFTDNNVWDKALPHSEEAERAILGAILIDNTLGDKAIESIQANEFYLASHRLIFRCMSDLITSNKPIDLVTLSDLLRRANNYEQIWGATFISSLLDNVGAPSTIEHYINLVRSKHRLRQLIIASNQIAASCLDGDEDDGITIENAYKRISEIREGYEESTTPLIVSCGEFMRTGAAESEEIAMHTRRRELLLCVAITNRGKSTLLRNLLLSLSCGREFKPFIDHGQPRKVLLVDFESSASRLRDDLYKMTEGWSEKELRLVRDNLMISCEAIIGDDLFNLNVHMGKLEREARKHGTELIAVDTASSAFDLRDENNNGEVARIAMKPLLKLARKLDCSVWLMHHIGKGSSEDANAVEKAYRGRGASAFGCHVATVFVLTAVPSDHSLVKISCAKTKDGKEYEVLMRLNQASRWFEKTNEAAPPPPPTSREIVRAVVIQSMRKGEIVAALKEAKLSERTIESCLKRDVAEGFLIRPKTGVYAPFNSATSAIL